ncbi:MAG: hypothetical protein H8E40_14955 [Chloroflexi bacterium]|nr:hypothetical protein [Chloroflexota bacterium]
MRRLLVTITVCSLLLGPPLVIGVVVLACRWPGSWLEALLYLGGAIAAWISLLAGVAQIFDRRLLPWPSEVKSSRFNLPPPQPPFYVKGELQFGILLTLYLKQKGWTYARLQECLERFGYAVSLGALEEYIAGRAYPASSMIHYVARCLNLDESEQEVLLLALMFDRIIPPLVYYMRMEESR